MAEIQRNEVHPDRVVQGLGSVDFRGIKNLKNPGTIVRESDRRAGATLRSVREALLAAEITTDGLRQDAQPIVVAQYEVGGEVNVEPLGNMPAYDAARAFIARKVQGLTSEGSDEAVAVTLMVVDGFAGMFMSDDELAANKAQMARISENGGEV